MKIYIKISVLTTLLLAVCSAQSQTHSFALWFSGNYGNFLSNTEYTKIGGIGGNIGLGYDLQAGGFLLQIGGEFQHNTSNVLMKEFTEVIPMLSTEGKYYDGTFTFSRNRDKQTMGNAAAVLKFGFITPSSFYMLFGAKYAYNLYGKTRTSTRVTSILDFEQYIGEDDEGIWSEMPNHGTYKKRRSLSEKLSFQPTIFGSLEAGFEMRDWNFLNARYRLAFFADFGVTSLTDKPLLNSSIIKNISQTEEFQPALRPFSYNQQTTGINVLLTGIKLTVLWGGESNHSGYCNCIQDIKWKRTKARKGSGRVISKRKVKKLK
jgi:hypothetical protein